MLRILGHMDRRLTTILGTVFDYWTAQLWDTSNRETQFEVPVVLENGIKGQPVRVYVNGNTVIGLEQEGYFFIRKDGSEKEAAWGGIANDSGRTLVQVNGNFSVRINHVQYQTRSMTYKATNEKIDFVREVSSDNKTSLPSCEADKAHNRTVPTKKRKPSPASAPIPDTCEDAQDASKSAPPKQRRKPPASAPTPEAQDASDSDGEDANPTSPPLNPEAEAAQSLPGSNNVIDSPFDATEVSRIDKVIEGNCSALKRLDRLYDLQHKSFEGLDLTTATYLNIIATIHETLSYVEGHILFKLNCIIQVKSMTEQSHDNESTIFENTTHRLKITGCRAFLEKLNIHGDVISESMPLSSTNGQNETIQIAIQERMNDTPPSNHQTNYTLAMLFFFKKCGQPEIKKYNGLPYIEFPEDQFLKAKESIYTIIDITAALANQVKSVIKQQSTPHLKSRLTLDINPW
jgi:hypothetical protein